MTNIKEINLDYHGQQIHVMLSSDGDHIISRYIINKKTGETFSQMFGSEAQEWDAVVVLAERAAVFV